MQANAILSREQILAAADIKREPVEIPEWGGTVLIQNWTGRQREEWEKLCGEHGPDNPRALNEVRASVAAISIVDEEGKPLFTQADRPALARLSAKALSRIWDAVFEVKSQPATA